MTNESTLYNPDDENFHQYLVQSIVFYSHNLLPDLIEFIDPHKIEDFLIRFGGCTVTFPPLEQFHKCFEDAKLLQVWDSYSKEEITTKQVSKILKMKFEDAKTRATSLKKLYSEMGICLKIPYKS